ncbi:hypothetical protein TWF481_007006 [Arthrobotrys musiformis]|uniref:Uncharacterized protein n=1 Tax=Arthrobotrys musiformis TaxID=47236 RepID=A0AAV9WA68_9PEZI
MVVVPNVGAELLVKPIAHVHQKLKARKSIIQSSQNGLILAGDQCASARLHRDVCPEEYSSTSAQMMDDIMSEEEENQRKNQETLDRYKKMSPFSYVLRRGSQEDIMQVGKNAEFSRERIGQLQKSHSMRVASRDRQNRLSKKNKIYGEP